MINIKNNLILLFIIPALIAGCEKNILAPDAVEIPDTAVVYASGNTSFCIFPNKILVVYLLTNISNPKYQWVSNGAIIDTTPSMVFPFMNENYWDFSVRIYSAAETTDFWLNIDPCSPAMFFPNSFSPNGDAINDEFHPVGYGVKDFYMEIRNSDGTVLFTTKDIKTGWDGRMNGFVLTMGMYFSYSEWTYTDGSHHKANGYVELVL